MSLPRPVRSRAPRSSRPAPAFGCERLEQRLVMSTLHWDGGGDGVTLTDKYNWECNQLPGIYDHAIIDVAWNPSIILTTGQFKVKRFTLKENLTVSGGLLSVSEQFDIASMLTVAGGTVGGNGNMNVAGDLKWTGGRLSGSGDTVIKPGGALEITGAGELELQRDLINHGDAAWNSGDLDLTDCPGTTITNAADGFFASVGAAKLETAGSGAFLNHGLFVRDGEGIALFLARFDNHGTANVVSGRLLLHSGGLNTGSRHVGVAGILHYFGDYTHGAGSTLTGGGTTIWQGGTHTIASDWTIASFVHVTNATVTGPGTLFIDGPLTWNSGTFAGEGGTVINPTGKISLMTPGLHVLSRDITNHGTLIWNRGDLRFEGATITNTAGNFFYVRADATAVSIEGAGQNLIVNHGEIRKQLATDLDFGGVGLDSAGHVNVRNGSLTLDPGALAQLSGGALTGGRWSLFGTAALDLHGASIATIGVDAVVSWVGSLSRFDALHGLTANEGSLTLGGGVTLVVGSGGDAVFTNTGTLSLRQGTRLDVPGGYAQTSSGTLAIEIATSQLLGPGRVFTASGVSLAGVAAFTFKGAFAPAAADSFLFIASGSQSGAFDSLSVPATPGLAGELIYGPVGVRLRFM